MIHSRLLMSTDENENGNKDEAEHVIDEYLKEKYVIPPEIYNENVLSPAKA